MTPTINLNRHFFLGGAGPGLLGLMGLALCFCQPVLAANSISWNTATLSFPASAFTGATIPISATVTNTGTATWDSAYHVVLQDREGVNVTMASVSGTAPGATITVTLYLTLPPMAGTYSYRLTALQHNTEYFGGILPRSVTVAVAPLPQNWSPVFSRVWLSKNLFLSVDPPTIDTNWPTSTYYRLRAKFPIAGNGLGFHAATSTENKGRPLDAVPPPGSYNPVTLYWLRYDADYNLLEQGPGSLQSVGVIEPAVALSSYWFHKRQRPTVVINQNLPANYRLVVHATDAATNAKLAVSWNNAARQLDGLPGAGTYRIEHYWQKYAPDGFTVLEVGKRKTETLTIVDGPNQTFTAAGNITGNDTFEEGSEEPTGRDYSADWYGLQVQTRGSLNLFSSVFTVPDGSSRTSLWYEFFSPDWTLLASGRDLGSFNFSVRVEPGEYHLKVGAYDDGGYQLTGIVTSAVPPPLVSNTELPAGVLGVAYPTDVKLVTVPAATVYHAGGLPLGLTCDSRTGQIYGTPLQAGTFEVMLWADNAGMAGDSKILPLTVARGLPVLTFPNRTAYNQPRIYPITTAMLNATVAGLPGMPAPTPKAITYRVSQGSPLTPTGSNPLGKYLSPYENASIKLTATYPGDANYAEISVEATFSDLIKFTPTAPSALRTVLRSPNGFSLAWLPPGGVPPGITTDFQFDVSLDGGATVATTVPYGQLSALIAGRPPATNYQVAVRARDVFGNTSDWSAAISAMTLGVGETPVTVARWLDVNGDGLADEVFDAATPAASGTPVFSHSITATTTHSVNYTEWVQYWARIPGYTYTTYSYLDNYARSYYVSARWEYAWEEVSQMIDVTVVRPEFITTPREGYIYKVGRLITRPDGTLGLNEIYTINPDVTVDGFNHWFPENFWAEAAYYTIPFVLVRYGKPIGSISLAGQFAAVTVGTTRGLGGILSVPFPASSNVVISLKDLANQVLKAGPKVVWEVWDRINQIRVGTSTVGDLLDIGINTSGEFQVGLKLDDSTQVWFNVSVQPPPAPKLAVDANRDGTIAFDAADATSASAPYRFWINDDDDSGDTGGDDIPGRSFPNFGTDEDGVGTIHGARDLIDWFPVAFDIDQLLTSLPPSSSVKYKLKQADAAVNFVYTNLTRDQAFNFQRTPQGATPLATGFGPGLTQAPANANKRRVTADGIDLFGGPPGSAAFLDAIQNHNGGVILVEGRVATTAPLVFSVESNGNVIAEAKLHLGISRVETMFRHLNLHDRNLPNLVGAMTGGTAQAEAMGDPLGFPDSPSSDNRWLIFVHGFNVGGQAARGWNVEMFKRCYWSGNKSRFVGVSWFGNPDSGVGPLPSDYHRSVRNAMVTAQTLAAEINTLPGTKTIFGHSLGTGVISSAIADHGMVVGKALFVDSSLARECFDGTVPSESVGMTPEAWRSYDSRLYASNWHERFAGTTDARLTLTWRNRFGTSAATNATGKVYHFYSSTEDVLAEYTGEVPETVFGVASTSGLNGAYVWTYQEKAKGVRVNYALGLTHIGSYYWGWGPNLFNPILQGDPFWYFANQQGRRAQTPAEIGTLATAHLEGMTRSPFFQPGWGTWNINDPTVRHVDTTPYPGVPDWIGWLFTSQGNVYSADPLKRNQLLAEAIPALSFPLGSRPATAFQDRNYNLPSLVDQANWPRGRPANNTPEWRHSDMREVAYLYQYRVFDQFVELAQP